MSGRLALLVAGLAGLVAAVGSAEAQAPPAAGTQSATAQSSTPSAQPAGSIGLGDLEGITIRSSVTYSGMFTVHRGTAPGIVTLSMQTSIGPGDNVRSVITRTVVAQTPRGDKRGARTVTQTGKIGLPGHDPSGNFLWLLSADQLLLLRTLDVGGFKFTITLSRAGDALACKVSGILMQEVGAGAGRTKSAAFAGDVRMHSMKQTGASCSVKRG
jgi:hypothetical protein